MPRGINDSSMAVPATIDGRSTATLWDEFTRTVDLCNQQRTSLTNLLSFPVTRASDWVPQVPFEQVFELSTEYGAPKSLRTSSSLAQVGYGFDWFDVATRFTARFLMDSTAEQVEQIHTSVLEADSQNLYRIVLRSIYNNVNETNNEGNTVYKLYNGDGTVPPKFQGNTFDGLDSHYLTSGAAVVDAGDLEQLIAKLQGKGVGTAGERFVFFVHPNEGKVIRSFKAGVAGSNGIVPSADFIPSGLAAPFWTSERIVGEVPPDQFNGLPVIGSYMGAYIAESYWAEPGYVLLFATLGPNNPANCVGLREHANPANRGLKIYPGLNNAYPLVNSFYARGAGSGTRRRANAAVMRIAASGGYAIPQAYV